MAKKDDKEIGGKIAAGGAEESGAADLDFQIAAEVAKLSKAKASGDVKLSVAALIQLVDLYWKQESVHKCKEAATQLLQIAGNPSLDIQILTNVVGAMYAYWKDDKYSKKGSLRLNISPERKEVLSKLTGLAESLVKRLESPTLQPMQLMIAEMKCSQGDYQGALDIYSDLITAQAADIDLTVAIFRAAAVLVAIGSKNNSTANSGQAIEYLDFLVDEPPSSAGYTSMHVLALLAVLYETSGDHYAVLLEKTYISLQEAYMADVEKGKKPVTNHKKLQEQLAKKSFSRSSEVWEALAVQAVDRCDYLFEFFFKKLVSGCVRCYSMLQENAQLCRHVKSAQPREVYTTCWLNYRFCSVILKPRPKLRKSLSRLMYVRLVS
jgi:hypothetical protein